MDDVCVTILGCSDAFSSGARGNTCFHIKSVDKQILLDCGATALYSMKKWELPSRDIDFIVITHFHGDHFAGIPFVLLDMLRSGHKKKLTIVSPPDGRKKISEAINLFYPGTSVLHKLDIDFIEFDGHQKLSHDGVTIESFPVSHSKATQPHGLRLELSGKTIAYTGDTQWTDIIPEILHNADVAICECTFYKKSFSGHINYKTLVQHLPEINCKKLLLTHFDDEMLEHINEVEPITAYDGMIITL